MRVRRRGERLLERASERGCFRCGNQHTKRERREKRREDGSEKRPTDRPTIGRTNERRIQQKRSLPSPLSLSSQSHFLFCVSRSLFRSFALFGPIRSRRRRRLVFCPFRPPPSPRCRHGSSSGARPSVRPPSLFPILLSSLLRLPSFLILFRFALLSLSRPAADGRTNGRTTYGLS